jgi:microcystin-dependent protein
VAETQTPNYHWVKPDIGGDASTWGQVLNTAFDAIDGVVYSNQQGVVPIGSITMFAGSTLPANYLWCNGAVYLDTDIPALAPLLARKYTGSDASHNAVPNLNGRFPIGSDFSAWTLGLTGGEATHTQLLAEMPSHTHAATEPAHSHTVTVAAHTHPITDVAHNHTASQAAHVHAVATGGHSHTIVTGNHAHNLSQNFGLSYTVPGGGGAQGVTAGVTAATTTTAGDLGGYTSTVGNLGGNTDTLTPAITVVASGSNLSTTQAGGAATLTSTTATPVITVTAQGSGAAANNMPPYTCLAFIIRYK